MLGYRGNADWRDMSEYVVHFTRADEGNAAYRSMTSILAEGQVSPSGPFGAARGLDSIAASQVSACFSEIPLDRLHRLVAGRSMFGVGFHQDVLVRAGGARVWYLDSVSPLAGLVRAEVSRRAVPGMDTSDAFWSLTPFIDFPGVYGDSRYQFEWEREWRVPGGLIFQPEDVSFLFIPEELHVAARSFFNEVKWENSGPGYDCPLLDALWDDDRMQQALLALD